jgi:hypothetical protein
MSEPQTAPYELADRIVAQLLRLRAAGGFDPRETAPGRGVWRWAFRAGGWPISVDLDLNVMEMRVYHDRDEVAMGRVRDDAMAVLLGRVPPPAEFGRAAPEDVLADLRRIVADWKTDNARIFTRPPVKVGHPDNWNDA